MTIVARRAAAWVVAAVLVASGIGVAHAAPTARPGALPAGADRAGSLLQGVRAAGPLPSVEPIFPSASPTPTATAKPQRRVAAPGERWALIVGVTDYRSPVHDTVAGAADARVVRDVLLRNGWRADHIRLLTDGAATGQAVRDGLAWLAERSGPETFSLVHYSGHVKQRDGHEYLWPVDNAFVSDTALVQAMRRVQGVSWTSISGCEADGFDDGLSGPTRLFTASSEVDEKSYEYPEWGMSVWTGVLWDQGLRDRQGDSNGDGRVSVQEATRWGAPRAAAITDRQRPYGPQHPQLAGRTTPLYLDAPITD